MTRRAPHQILKPRPTSSLCASVPSEPSAVLPECAKRPARMDVPACGGRLAAALLRAGAVPRGQVFMAFGGVPRARVCALAAEAGAGQAAADAFPARAGAFARGASRHVFAGRGPGARVARGEVVALLRQHLRHNLLRFRNRWHVQTRGIPQARPAARRRHRRAGGCCVVLGWPSVGGAVGDFARTVLRARLAAHTGGAALANPRRQTYSTQAHRQGRGCAGLHPVHAAVQPVPRRARGAAPAAAAAARGAPATVGPPARRPRRLDRCRRLRLHRAPDRAGCRRGRCAALPNRVRNPAMPSHPRPLT